MNSPIPVYLNIIYYYMIIIYFVATDPNVFFHRAGTYNLSLPNYLIILSVEETTSTY